MNHLKYVFFLLIGTACVAVKQPRVAAREFHFTGVAQGTTYHITYYAGDSVVTHSQVDSIFRKIDSSLSIYKPYSLISQFNETASEIMMDDHLKTIVKKSLEIYRKTGGISDITVYPLVKAWGFGPGRSDHLPDSAAIDSLLACVGSDKIYMEQARLVKTKPCVKIDVNGIAQGYTVDVIAEFLLKNKIQDYLVEVGGEIRVRGHKQPGNHLFQIGIESPAENSFEEPVVKKIMTLDHGAVTTSGNYRKYFEKGGQIFSHLMNPKTGYPLQNELISVTIFAKDAMTADGYDNALMGMGLKNSFLFLREHRDMEAYFIYHTPGGRIADTATAGFYRMMEPG